MNNRKTAIVQALQAFIAQRPGMDPRNYGDWASYRQESREVTKDRAQAETMLNYVDWHESIGADTIIEGFRGAFSGRLKINESADGKVSIDYCTGQYFPTEYRRAVCSGLSAVLWDYFRSNGAETGDAIRKTAKRELPRAIAIRWFR